MSELNTTAQVACVLDHDTVTITLPGTTLHLNLDESDALFGELRNELICDLFASEHGEDISDTVTIVGVSVPRPLAWRISGGLEHIYFRDVIEEIPNYWPDDPPTFDPHDFDWRTEGF